MEQRKSSKSALIAAAVVLVAGIGLAVYALNSGTTKNNQATEQRKATTPEAKSSKAVVGSTVITFTDKGFDKSTYTAKAGEAVTVKNASSNDLQFSSGEHPTHREHPELNMDILAPGESGTVLPAGKGTYSFHDHIEPQFTGTLIVQ